MSRNAWLTPSENTPVGYDCYTIAVPTGVFFKSVLLGAIAKLTDIGNWEQHGTLTPIECATLFEKTVNSIVLGESECDMIGTIQPYATTTIPKRLIPCDGGVYQKSDYPRLYEALVGTPLIVDTDTFRTPQLEGRFLRGTDTNNVQNGVGGSDTKTISIENLPEHDHTYQAVIFNVDIESVGIPDPVGAGIDPIPRHTSKVGNGVPIDVKPAYYTVKWGIVAK